MTASSSASTPVLRFSAGRLPIKIVGVTVMAAGCAGAAVWTGLDLLQSWGIEPVDGGVLKPLWQRAVFAGIVAFLGVGFLAGMLMYWRYYITSMELADEGRTVLIRRLFPFPLLKLPVDEVSVGTRVRGAYRAVPLPSYTRSSLVDAPWLSVRLRGWRLPLILDMQGKFPDGAPGEKGAEQVTGKR